MHTRRFASGLMALAMIMNTMIHFIIPCYAGKAVPFDNSNKFSLSFNDGQAVCKFFYFNSGSKIGASMSLSEESKVITTWTQCGGPHVKDILIFRVMLVSYDKNRD